MGNTQGDRSTCTSLVVAFTDYIYLYSLRIAYSLTIYVYYLTICTAQNFVYTQWQIQNFPEGAPTSPVVLYVNTKESGPLGVGHMLAAPPGSANQTRTFMDQNKTSASIK